MNIQTGLQRALLLLFTCFAFSTQNPLNAQITRLENGDQISWDGQYYDFKDAEGRKMIKLWVPPGDQPVKGILISGHGGGSGDSRQFARDKNIRDFAMRLGFGVAGLHNFPGRRVYEEGAAVFFHALESFASLGKHPELKNIPFAIYGSSNGGSTAYGFVNYAPEKALCFLSNVMSGSRPEIPVAAALKVPGIFIVGKFDALTGERGMNMLTRMMADVLPQGALWTWAVELKGHEDGHAFDVYTKLVEQSVKVRYPEDADPRKGPVNLKELERKDGWLADLDSWDEGLVYVDSWSEYQDNKATAGWLLNKDMAFIYRAMASHHNPMEIKVREFDKTLNTHTDPGTMFSLGGPVADPGETVHLVCHTDGFPDWEKISFYNGAEKLGEVEKGQEPVLRITLEAQALVYCLTVIAEDNKGIKRTASPMHFFIRDPESSWETPVQKAVFNTGRTGAGTRNYGQKINITEPEDPSSTLVAYGLSPRDESSFSVEDGEISGFWTRFGDQQDHISLTQRANARDGAQFNFVLTHDANMEIRSAYGADGLYLLFTVNDDQDIPSPNDYIGTENEQFMHEFDAVDFMIDSRSPEEIGDTENRDIFVSPSFGWTNTTVQYQANFGSREAKPVGVKRTIPDPWDIHATFWSFDDLKKYFGIQIETVKTDPFYRAQEWFIPWEQIGEGFSGEPEAGTGIGFSGGFNDRDPGEHLPVGVSSSGGTTHASNGLRWINKSDPWGSGPAYGEPPYNWGEIILGPVLE